MDQTTRLAAIVLFWSCSSSQKDEPGHPFDSTANVYEYGFDANTFESYLRLDNYLTGIKIPPEQMQVIETTSAIVVNPTIDQLNEMTEDYGEDDLANISDDQGYFQSNARHILDSASINIIEAEKRFIKLNGDNNKSWVLDIRKEGAPAWNLILFNIRKEPEIIPATDLTRNKIAMFFDLKGN